MRNFFKRSSGKKFIVVACNNAISWLESGQTVAYQSDIHRSTLEETDQNNDLTQSI